MDFYKYTMNLLCNKLETLLNYSRFVERIDSRGIEPYIVKTAILMYNNVKD